MDIEVVEVQAPPPSRPVAVIVGEEAEARVVDRVLRPIFGDSRLLVLVAGNQPAAIREAVQAAVAANVRCILSCGVAAGLIAGLKTGTIVVSASMILPTGDILPVNPILRQQVMACLKETKPWLGPVAGIDRLPHTPEEKATLHSATAAWAADGQSHIAFLAARAADIPFVVVRAVMDPADRVLPLLLRVMWQAGAVPVVMALAWLFMPLQWLAYRQALDKLGQHLALLGPIAAD